MISSVKPTACNNAKQTNKHIRGLDRNFEVGSQFIYLRLSGNTRFDNFFQDIPLCFSFSLPAVRSVQNKTPPDIVNKQKAIELKSTRHQSTVEKK